jgi:hypothetical protein
MKRLPVELDALIPAFEYWRSRFQVILNLDSGEVVAVSQGPWLGESPVEGMREVQEEPDRFLPVPRPSRDACYGDMVDFRTTVTHPDLGESLDSALHVRYPFAAFARALANHPDEKERWIRFKAKRSHERVLHWLREHGIEPEA